MNAVKEADAEEEDHGDDSCPAAEFLEKVRTQSKLLSDFLVMLLFSCLSSWHIRRHLRHLTGRVDFIPPAYVEFSYSSYRD